MSECTGKSWRYACLAVLAVGLSVSLPAADPPAAPAFVFRDVGDEAGLFPHVAGIAGHAVGWGDMDGSGWPSLYVGTFGGYPYSTRFPGFGRCQRRICRAAAIYPAGWTSSRARSRF